MMNTVQQVTPLEFGGTFYETRTEVLKLHDEAIIIM